MPPPTAHTPSAADPGGRVIVPVTLLTVPLSNSGTKTAAKPSGMCPITLPVELHLYCHFALKVMGFSLTKKFSPGPPARKHGSISHGSISNML